MIAKGMPHRHGAVLARYLVTGKDHERAELWELRGFPCTGIVPAFRSVHVMAAATKCLAPFFHVSVRNPDGDNLDRSQWEVVANAVERMLGLTDQPRAVAFHTAGDTGHAHMHIAWSRIDQETLTAKPLPFFKQRLKQVCRELEERFGLTAVPNERRSSVRFAPTRSEEEQARRLGVDVHATRECIRNCFEQSDCGRSFRDALAQAGFVLVRGDRRDFLAVNREGAMQALGKRVVGVSAAEIRLRLADLDHDHLPTLEQAREFIATNKQLSANATVEDVRHHTKDPAKPVSARKRPRNSVAEGIDAAVGKEHLGDRVRTRIVTTSPASPLNHPEIETPVPNDPPDSENEPIRQLVTQTFDSPRSATHSSQFLPTMECPTERDSGPGSLGEPAGTETDTAAPIPKPPGLAARLRDQFRAVVKQLTARDPAPHPTARKRRREEIGGSFGKAASGLLRCIARIPPLNFLDPTWETFTWLHLWEYNSGVSADFHQDRSASPPPEDLSLRL